MMETGSGSFLAEFQFYLRNQKYFLLNQCGLQFIIKIIGINIQDCMSLLIRNQFFELCLNNQQDKNSSEFFTNLKELLPDWHFETNKNHALEALTTELTSSRFNNLHYLVNLNLSFAPDIMAFTFFILKNNVPLKVQSKLHRIKLYSFFLRINTNIMFGKFSLCPKSGLLAYNHHTFLTQSQISNLSLPNNKVLKNNLQIFQKIEQSCLTLQYYLTKIFQLLNLNQPEQKNQLRTKSVKKHQITTYDHELSLLQKLLPYAHEDINYLVKSNFKIKENQNLYNLNSLSILLKSYDNNIHLNSSIPQLSIQKLQEIQYISKYNNYNTVNRQKTYKNNIFAKKASLMKQKNISKNVNCKVDLYSGLKYNSTEMSQKSHFYFIVKSAESSKGQKMIEREKKFLDLLMGSGGKSDIGEILEITTKNSASASKPMIWQERSICMSYYALNVGQYVEKRRQFMSQTSKLLLLLKIFKAISSLHNQGCQHMDLKPQNIMMDNQQNIKLIDFGQSIHQNLPLSSKPGVSIPYSPPEFFSKYKFTPYRCDIYSLGVMIFEIIFGQVPQNLPSRKEKALLFYQSSSSYKQFFQTQPQKLENACQKKFSQLVAGFCLKCMNENPALRPSQSWIRVYLKKFTQLSYYF